jgi:threonine dehydrogenase-like Zn-dependent dehydrogenase
LWAVLLRRPSARGAPPVSSASGGQVTLDVSADLLRRQVTLVGSWTFSKQGQAECAEFIAERNVDVERLFTHRWRLEQAEEAYRLFDTQTTGKAVILPS